MGDAGRHRPLDCVALESLDMRAAPAVSRRAVARLRSCLPPGRGVFVYGQWSGKTPGQYKADRATVRETC